MTAKEIKKIIELGRILHVRKYLRSEWKRRYETYKPSGVDGELSKSVKGVWGKVHPNLMQIAWYNHINEITPPYNPFYLSDNLYYGVIDLFYIQK